MHAQLNFTHVYQFGFRSQVFTIELRTPHYYTHSQALFSPIGIEVYMTTHA